MIQKPIVQISLQGLRKVFDGIIALNGVQVELESSGIVAIIGPNGAGKTTLLDIATARLQPDVGCVAIKQHALGRKTTPDFVAKLGVARTFQELRLFRKMSVVENLMVAQRNHSSECLLRAILGFGLAGEEAKHYEEAIKILRFVGLEGEAQSLAGELSYGQQKLVSLAQCLATTSDVFFLDEPVAGVHPRMVETICQVLRRMAEDGNLIVLVEHDIDVVRKLANRVIVMDQGRIIADGEPVDVLGRPEILEAYVG